MTIIRSFFSKNIGLPILGIRKKASSVDLFNILSEQNKQRCQTQLKALEDNLGLKSSSDSDSQLRKAAVLIPLCFVDCQPSIVFTLRSSKLRSHAGQVSFPGGMVSEDDSSSIEAALRESEEELGLRVEDVDIWGRMLPIPDRFGKVQITPVIANIGNIHIDDFKLNFDEVECVFTRDISSLCSAKNFAQTTFSSPKGGGYTVPVFLGGEHRIWGLTAILLHQTLNLIAPGMYRNKVRHPRSLRGMAHEARTLAKRTNSYRPVHPDIDGIKT